MLDSTFLIDLERGREEALAVLDLLVERDAPLVVPPQAAAEVLAGRADAVAGLADIERSFEVLSLGRDEILQTARLARTALADGTFPGWADTQIAAHARLADDVVVTEDVDHFRALGCRVWDYPNDAEPSTGQD